MLTGILLGAFLGYFIPLMVARFADEMDERIEAHVAAALDEVSLDDLDQAGTLDDIDWTGGAR